MESIQIKKAIFYQDKIVLLRKKGDITINIDNISELCYDKPSFFNFLLAFITQTGFSVRVLEIRLNKPINKKRTFVLRIKFKELRKLPEIYLKKLILAIECTYIKAFTIA